MLHVLSRFLLVLGLTPLALAQAPNPNSPDVDFAGPFLKGKEDHYAGVYAHDAIHTPDGRLVVAFVERRNLGAIPGTSQVLTQDEFVVLMRPGPTQPWTELSRGHYNHDAIADVHLATPRDHYNDPKRDWLFVGVTLETFRRDDGLPGKIDPSVRQRAVAVLRGSYKAPNPKSKWFQVAIPQQSLAYVSSNAVRPRPRVATVPTDSSASHYYVDLVFVDPSTSNSTGGVLWHSRSTNNGGFFPKPARLTGPAGADRVKWIGEPKGSKLSTQLFLHPSLCGSWTNRYTALAFQDSDRKAIEVVRITANVLGETQYEYEHRIHEGGKPLIEPAIAVADEGATLLARGMIDYGDGAMELLWYRGGVTKGAWSRNTLFGGGNLLQRAFSAPDVDVRGNWMRVACLGRPDNVPGPRQVMAIEGRWRPSSSVPLGIFPVDDGATGKATGLPTADLQPLGASAHSGAAYVFQLQSPGAIPEYRYVRLDD